MQNITIGNGFEDKGKMAWAIKKHCKIFIEFTKCLSLGDNLQLEGWS